MNNLALTVSSCGHGAIDDPDASIVFAETMELLAQPRYSAIAKDVVVMRIGPSDQSKFHLWEDSL